MKFNINTALLSILALIAVGAVLKMTFSFVVPLIIAVLLSFILTPVLISLSRFHVPRFLGILIIMLILFGIIYLGGLFVYTSVQNFIQEFPKYQERLVSIFSTLWDRYDLSADVLEGFSWASTVTPRLVKISGSFVGFLKGLGLMILFLVFILSETTASQRKLRMAFPSKITDRIEGMVGDVYLQVSRYLSIKLFISALTGLLVGLACSIIGLDFALMWGVLAFILNFVPNLGSFFVMLVTILFSMVQFYPSWGHVLAVTISVVTIQLVLGNLIDPKMQGNSLDLSPLLIIISLMFWGWLWGIIGMILAVPIMASMKIIFANFQGLHPFSVLMGSGKNPVFQPAHPPYRLFEKSVKTDQPKKSSSAKPAKAPPETGFPED